MLRFIVAASLAIVAASACPKDDLPLSGKCIHFSPIAMSWQDALHYCAMRNGGELFASDDPADIKAVQRELWTRAGGQAHWIAAFFNWKTQTWVWGTTGKTVTLPELLGDRHSSADLQWNCAVLGTSQDYAADPRPCYTKQKFICSSKGSMSHSPTNHKESSAEALAPEEVRGEIVEAPREGTDGSEPDAKDSRVIRTAKPTPTEAMWRWDEELREWVQKIQRPSPQHRPQHERTRVMSREETRRQQELQEQAERARLEWIREERLRQEQQEAAHSRHLEMAEERERERHEAEQAEEQIYAEEAAEQRERERAAQREQERARQEKRAQELAEYQRKLTEWQEMVRRQQEERDRMDRQQRLNHAQDRQQIQRESRERRESQELEQERIMKQRAREREEGVEDEEGAEVDGGGRLDNYEIERRRMEEERRRLEEERRRRMEEREQERREWQERERQRMQREREEAQRRQENVEAMDDVDNPSNEIPSPMEPQPYAREQGRVLEPVPTDVAKHVARPHHASLANYYREKNRQNRNRRRHRRSRRLQSRGSSRAAISTRS